MTVSATVSVTVTVARLPALKSTQNRRTRARAKDSNAHVQDLTAPYHHSHVRFLTLLLHTSCTLPLPHSSPPHLMHTPISSLLSSLPLPQSGTDALRGLRCRTPGTPLRMLLVTWSPETELRIEPKSEPENQFLFDSDTAPRTEPKSVPGFKQKRSPVSLSPSPIPCTHSRSFSLILPSTHLTYRSPGPLILGIPCIRSHALLPDKAPAREHKAPPVLLVYSCH